MNTKNLLLLFSIALVQGFFTPAFSQTFTTTPGEKLEVDGVDTSDSLVFTAFDGRSYCCRIKEPTGSGGLSFDNVSASSGTVTDLASQGQVDPWLRNGSNARRCFTFTETPGQNGIADITLGIAATGTVNNVAIQCTETTLFGGFNTVVTDFNFIEVTNTLTDETAGATGVISVRIVATGTSGSEVLSTSFDLNPDARFDVNVHDSAPSDFGPVIITHNGPPGAIRAVNAQYRIVTSTPLDFEPVLVVPFREGRP